MTMSRHQLLWLSASITFVAMTTGRALATPIKWDVNNHWYDRIDVTCLWGQANAYAQASSFQGVQGHLATVTSADEEAFLNAHWYIQYYWLGGSQLPDQATPSTGWQWVTGEPWAYTDWQWGEPNDAGDKVENNQENQLIGWNTKGWNDYPARATTGYFVEYDGHMPEPASGTLFGIGMGLLAMLRRRRLAAR
jgi:hypothetical protein